MPISSVLALLSIVEALRVTNADLWRLLVEVEGGAGFGSGGSPLFW